MSGKTAIKVVLCDHIFLMIRLSNFWRRGLRSNFFFNVLKLSELNLGDAAFPYVSIQVLLLGWSLSEREEISLLIRRIETFLRDKRYCHCPFCVFSLLFEPDRRVFFFNSYWGIKMTRIWASNRLWWSAEHARHIIAILFFQKQTLILLDLAHHLIPELIEVLRLNVGFPDQLLNPFFFLLWFWQLWPDGQRLLRCWKFRL